MKAEDKTVVTDGVVVNALSGMEYEVKINFNGIDHLVKCYVSGKMKKNFIEIKKGDEVTISISLYDIDRGIIARRLTKRGPRVSELVQNKPSE